MSEYTGRTLSSDVGRRINFSSYSIYFLAIGLFLFLTFATNTFFSFENLYSISLDISIQFYAIVGFTLLLIMGEIDMSVGSVFGFSGALAGYLFVKSGLPFWIAFLLTVLLCAGVGLINGLVVVKFHVSSMMVTIGMMTVMAGFKAVLIGQLSSRVFTGDFRSFMRMKLGDIHWTIIALVILIVVFEILLLRSYKFKVFYFVGQNSETAKIYGIKSDRIRMMMFVMSAVTAGIGGVIAASRVAHAAATAGVGLEFTMITAAVLGGASLFGGKGSILRSAVGLFFLAMVTNGMVSFSVDPYIQQVVLGLILIIAVTVDIVFTRKSRA
ncbi:ABC transporter permease [Clostridia bacterium]|nr:ABC transporter permease [Clostridia bacterium]